MTEPSYMTQQMDSLVRTAAAQFGLRLVADLTLEVNGEPTRFDYVVMDRFGFLILAAEPMSGRVLSGASGDTQWKSQADGEKPVRFGSPLKDNQKRIAALKEALVVTGRRFADEYFTDLVVFAGADTSGLKLSGIDQLKVIDARDLLATLQARYDFAPNAGILEPQQIEDLISLFRALDRSESHGLYAVSSAPAPSGIFAGFRAPNPSTVAVADHMAGLAPAAPRLSGDRYPSLDSGRRPLRPLAAGLLGLLLVAALGTWLFRFGGYSMVVSNLMALLPQESPAVPQQSASGGPTISVDHAETRLQSMQPQIFAHVTNHGTPRVVNEQGVSKFTWTYTVSEKGELHYYTLGFDASGKVVYVDSE